MLVQPSVCQKLSGHHVTNEANNLQNEEYFCKAPGIHFLWEISITLRSSSPRCCPNFLPPTDSLPIWCMISVTSFVKSQDCASASELYDVSDMFQRVEKWVNILYCTCKWLPSLVLMQTYVQFRVSFHISSSRSSTCCRQGDVTMRLLESEIWKKIQVHRFKYAPSLCFDRRRFSQSHVSMSRDFLRSLLLN